MRTDSKPIRILTADDHPLLRYVIAALVGAEPDMELVAQASTGQEAIEEFRLPTAFPGLCKTLACVIYALVQAPR